MHSLTWSNLLTHVEASPVGVLGVAILVLGYGWAWRRSARAGCPVPGWRSGVYFVFGVFPFAVATCSGLALLRAQTLQAAAWQAGLLVAVVPTGIAIARPLTLVRAALPVTGQRRLSVLLGSRVARVVGYPIVATTSAVALLLAYLSTGWFQATLDSTPLRELSYLVLVTAGCLFTLPLMGETQESLPAWCTPGVRVLLAFVDGIIDAVPGVVLMTTGVLLWRPTTMGVGEALLDEHLAGAVLLGVTEVIGIPVLIATFVAWVRADRADAVRVDLELDALADADVSTVPWWLDHPPDAHGPQRAIDHGR